MSLCIPITSEWHLPKNATYGKISHQGISSHKSDFSFPYQVDIDICHCQCGLNDNNDECSLRKPKISEYYFPSIPRVQEMIMDTICRDRRVRSRYTSAGGQHMHGPPHALPSLNVSHNKECTQRSLVASLYAKEMGKCSISFGKDLRTFISNPFKGNAFLRELDGPGEWRNEKRHLH